MSFDGIDKFESQLLIVSFLAITSLGMTIIKIFNPEYLVSFDFSKLVLISLCYAFPFIVINFLFLLNKSKELLGVVFLAVIISYVVFLVSTALLFIFKLEITINNLIKFIIPTEFITLLVVNIPFKK